MGNCWSVDDDRNDYDYYQRRQGPRLRPDYNGTEYQYYIRSTTTQVARPVPPSRPHSVPRSRSCTRSVPSRDLVPRTRSKSCTRTAVTKRSEPKPEPLYGEFKCSSCGRFWRSLLSWRNGYQVCKHCKSKVYPTNQREVRPTDRTRDIEDVGEHPKEFCQKCQQLGRFCGKNY